MALLLPTRWQKQPQGPVEIDWSHPLAKNLTGFWILNTALPINLVDGVKSSFSTKPTEGVRSQGRVVTLPFVTNKFNNELFDINNAIGTIAHGYYSSVTSYTNSAGVGARLNQNDLIGATGIFRAGFFDFGVRLSVAVTETVGNHFLALSSGHDGLLRGYKDNAILGSTTKASSVTLQTSNSFGFGYFDSSTTGNALSGYYFATWKRSLSPTEIAEFRSNPYALLRPQRRLIGVDLSIFDLDIDADLTMPAPILSADASVLGAGDLIVEASLSAPSPSISGDGVHGLVAEASLKNIAPVINIEGGQFTSVNASLKAPSPTLTADAIIGTVLEGSLRVPTPLITGDGVHGIIAEALLTMPAPEISAQDAPQIILTGPSPSISGQAVIGLVANATLTAPRPNITIEATTEQINVASLTMPAPRLTAEIVVDNVIDAVLTMPTPQLTANALAGLAIEANLTMPAPIIGMDYAGSLSADATLKMPAPVIIGEAYMTQLRSGKFYNRWTR